MSSPHHYDYIIAGAGCAGLSLLMRMIESGVARDKKILVVDRDPKKKNDRTWCFWEKEPGFFEPLVYHRWQNLWFCNHGFEKQLDTAPYTYKLVRGIDFYHHCFSVITSHPGIRFLQANVDGVFSNEQETGVVVNSEKYYCRFLFNSILFGKPELKEKEYWMLQHFKGWTIETKAPAFDAQTATLMDFRTAQDQGATFFYVLPFSENRALVEYTLFSDELLPPQEYDAALRRYLGNRLGIREYQVCEQEFGIIPMTNHRFPQRQHNMLFMGTAGGQTKGSSGYTFRFIQKQAAAIVQSLAYQDHPFQLPDEDGRFRFYDSVLLHILQKKKLEGAAVFTDLFRKNKAADVFRFLDNESSLPQDLRIISSLPFFPFLKAGLREFGR